VSWVALAIFASMVGIGDAPMGGEENWGTKCLAAVGYAEARSESILGEACVDRVVLNRAVVEQRPIYDVVLAVDQFARPTSTAEKQAWARSRWLAVFSISDAWPLPDFCHQATHFNQSDSPRALGRIGKHVFYP